MHSKNGHQARAQAQEGKKGRHGEASSDSKDQSAPKKVIGIYIIRNIETNGAYVGNSIDIKKRLSQHRWELQDGSHVNRHLQAAWRKYGPAAFIFEIVELVETKDRLVEREGWWIDNHATYNHMAPRRHDLSAETKARMSASRTGKKMPEHQRLALKAAVKGRKFPETAYANRWTPERRRKASILRKAQGGVVPRGKWTPERRQALVERQKKMWANPAYLEKMRALRKAHPEWLDAARKAKAVAST